MTELSQRNKDRLAAWVARQARLRDPVSSIDPCLIENPDHSSVFRCPACFDIPRFPIIASCKHVLCHDCFIKMFHAQLFSIGNNYFTTCPESCKNLSPDDVHTFSQEKLANPTSAVFAFYNSIRVLCDNTGCNKFISYDSLFNHEFYLCSFRRIACPAECCPSVAPPDLTLRHTLNCPLHFTWCGTCLNKFTYVIY